MTRWKSIYEFWFGLPGSPGHGEVREFWFNGGPEIDQVIGKRFADDHIYALDGGYDSWSSDPRGCISLIILLDQFPRNIFRGKPQSFDADQKALTMARGLIESPSHGQLIDVEKLFAYLPFQHSENGADQALSVNLYRAIATHKKKAEWLDFAEQHKVIVDKFGRFPHRNAILGRKDTAAEAMWLRENDQRFGAVAEGSDAR